MDEVETALSRGRGRVTSRDGTPIAYERYGDGPPIVLVSGALGTAATERPLGLLLARGFSVVAYDRRGRGGSGDTGPYAVEREIEDLAAVVAEAGAGGAPHDGVALYGTGTGGVLALAAVAAGLPVGHLSVYEPPYSVETVPERLLVRVHARVLVVDGGASPAGTRRAARALAAALPRARHRTLTGQTHEVAPHVLAPVLEEFLSEDRETVEAA
ncbi:alpha/beta fold hydrolase [Streptomyces sp. NPDC093795]|uniref:alpha/beta fold hydrolase n=1 Tax=Streptomyces sp. NPDC093795 TaxID=3366051 RepID=UPI0038002EB2